MFVVCSSHHDGYMTLGWLLIVSRWEPIQQERVIAVPRRSVILICMLACSLAFALPPKPIKAEPQKYTVEIRPEMELMSGVLAHTDWMKVRGPSGQGNEYFRALRAHFAPYKDHKAVAIAAQLTAKGFVYEAPPWFICHLGPLPELEMCYEYNEQLIRRAGSREILEEFRLALRDLAEQSNFAEFIAQHQSDYDRWIASVGLGLDSDQVIDWLEGFFGKEAGEFHLVLAPAMFPAGGYGPSVRSSDGDLVVFQIVRERGKSSNEPEFQSDLQSLALHEWGHSFVNPALEKHPEQAAQLQPHFMSVARRMSKIAYGTRETFLNEQVLRAVTCLATEELKGQSAMEREAAAYEQIGFFLTRPTIELLREYQQDRNRYPDFNSFAPILLERLSQEKPARAFWLWPITLGLGGTTAVAIVVGRRLRNRMGRN